MLTEPALASILADAELAYLAVETPRGPLVTPLLFTASDDRIWMVMPRSSAKVAAIGRNPFVGLAAGRPDAMVVLQGSAHLVDPLRPQSLLSSLPETLRSPRAMSSYVANNVAHLAGLIGPGALAPRTVAAMRPQRAVTVRGNLPLWSAGTWPDAPRPGAGRPNPTELRVVQDVPAAIRSLTT
ncbi:MAG: pyridoxamine 5'-phosphate oxidase family protein, partial [Actinomycetota bacterium]|nr:pyridoxamine 5'-phosphate oxidase family protein [Actinomycetota bacterium]